MTTRRRSVRQLTADLKRLAQRADGESDRTGLLHEVQVCEEELSVQSAELIRAQEVLEDTRGRFEQLYDFAPNGYLILDADGVIQQINLTGASLIGRQRHGLEGTSLMGFVPEPERAGWLDFMRKCRACKDGARVEGEMRLALADGERHVHMICRPRYNDSAARREYLTVLSDVTERRQLEMENARVHEDRAALASRLIGIQDEERQRIARDLHDNLGQQMTALRLKLEAISGVLAPRRQAALLLEQAQQMLGDLDRQLSFIAAELRPAVLDLGIVPALERYVRYWSDTFGIPASFQAIGVDGVKLDAEAETQLYRVAQESLNNVQRHAGATMVTVLLQRKGPGISLLVEDDGRGFDPCRTSAPAQDRGFGLIGMRERAGIVSGTIQVESAPGRGTTIMFYVPSQN